MSTPDTSPGLIKSHIDRNQREVSFPHLMNSSPHMENPLLLLLIFTLFFHAFSSARSQPYIGVNYGEVADNLPAADATARLLQSTTITKVRLYGADPVIIRALSGTNISLIIGASNADIPSIAAAPSAAAAWVSANVLPFLPASSISAVSVGNEVLYSDDPSLSSTLLPAMQNLRSALSAAAASSSIKVSTVHSMAVLSQSDPPSSAAFRADIASTLQPILQFLNDTDSPFMINPYPYFAFQSDPRPETLAFCLFRTGPGRPDPGSGVTYTNMFDAQVAAVRAALQAAGYGGAELVVAETGWPYRGDAAEAGASVENARDYNGNLVAHLRATPDPVETYIFALYDEDLKPGPTSERSFGLFRPDLTPIYDAGLLKTAPAPIPTATGETNTAPMPASAGRTNTSAPIPAVSGETNKAAPAEVCVPGRGGAACGQPEVQQYLPSVSTKSGACSGRRRRVLDFFFCTALFVFSLFVYA